jgi:hypothetical protein
MDGPGNVSCRYFVVAHNVPSAFRYFCIHALRRKLQIIHSEHRKPSLAAEQFFPILMQKIEHIYSMVATLG